jgi:hypothetical protein
MFEFKLTRESESTVLEVSGTILGDEDRVQPADNLILDLSELHDLDPGAAILLHDILIRRAIVAESVIVSVRSEVSMQLVLHDVDRVCPIVSNIDFATDILDRPWAKRRLRR